MKGLDKIKVMAGNKIAELNGARLLHKGVVGSLSRKNLESNYNYACFTAYKQMAKDFIDDPENYGKHRARLKQEAMDIFGRSF